MPNPIDEQTGARVRACRKALGMSQQLLGERLGLTFQQVQKYERGHNRISASKLVETARVLGTTVAHLVGEDEGGYAQAATPFHALAVGGARQLVDLYAAMTAPQRNAILNVAKAVAGAVEVPAPAAGPTLPAEYLHA